MKLVFEIWQLEFNSQWYCDMWTKPDSQSKNFEFDDLISCMKEVNKQIGNFKVVHDFKENE